ncbi:glycosyltransferase family 90 protein [Tulasnella calospora MUT 4182]|uniref:Glycosyltransferase family 90 protein n=1 Tax=Tulasnella calospora MUT 4182 TaxID=1051891 RepID=A0A0C3MHW8_9AGAM|nr:glycosyltransferase family 90 protein [Tulasnella calospora MUT 4182]
MAPLSEAIRTTFKESLKDGTQIYECIADPQWTFGVVTYGGYSLGLVVDAARKLQTLTSHPDIIHLSSQFLRATVPGPMEIRILTVRTGKQFTNLTAEVHQKDTLKITIQLIFGNFERISKSAEGGMSMPANYVPLHPLVVHPSKAKLAPPHWAQKFSMHYIHASDPYFEENNKLLSTEGGNIDGLMMGSWLRLIEAEDVKMSPTYIPFVVDMVQVPWAILPEEHTKGKEYWNPSLTIAIEFKCRLPLPPDHASHTLAIFSRKRHLKDGIWNDATEIWSAPSELGDEATGEIDEKWREKMVCVAVASQVAFMASGDINLRYAKGDKSRL